MKVAYYYYYLYIKSKPKKIDKVIRSIIDFFDNNIPSTGTNILEPIYNMIENIINLICSSGTKPDDLVCLTEGVFLLLNRPEIQNDKGKIKNLNKFLVLIYKIINGKKKQKPNAKIIEQINNIINKYEIKISTEKVLKMKYEEYLDKKYAPGGKGYFKAKEDFEKRSANERKNENELNKITSEKIK
jgi:hypothetical protein